MINKPMLPPISGHVEIEVDGVRQYSPPLPSEDDDGVPVVETRSRPTTEQILNVLLGEVNE